MGVLLHLHSFIIPFVVIAATAYRGAWVWLPVFLVLVAHPIIDNLLGDRKPRTTPAPNALATALPLIYVPIQMLMVGLGLLGILQAEYSPWELAGLTLSTGLTGGAIGITAGHELVHRLKRWQRAFGVAVLGTVSYMHFRVEHVFGHHKSVATPDDPATAPRGMSVYAFYPRSMIGVWKKAWEIESRRARARNCSIWDPRANRTLLYAGVQLAGVALIGAAVGTEGVLFFLGQSLIAVLLLETINYVEHYGLERKPKGAAYEAQTEMHSWDTDRRASNWFTFNLGRHANHHMFPLKPYETLDIHQKSPRLPAGYSAMMWLAWIPPLWRRVMDPLIPR